MRFLASKNGPGTVDGSDFGPLDQPVPGNGSTSKMPQEPHLQAKGPHECGLGGGGLSVDDQHAHWLRCQPWVRVLMGVCRSEGAGILQYFLMLSVLLWRFEATLVLDSDQVTLIALVGKQARPLHR